MPSFRHQIRQAETRLQQGPHPQRARLDAETLLLHLLGKNRAWLLAHLDDDFAGCSALGYAALLNRRLAGEPIQYITGACEFYGLPFHVTPAVLIPRPETEHLVETALKIARAPSSNAAVGAVGAPRLASETWESNEPRVPQVSQRQGQRTPGAPSLARSLGQGWETTSSNPSVGAPRLAFETCESNEPHPATWPGSVLDVGTGSGAIAIALAHHLPRARVTAIDLSAAALDLARENALRNGVNIRFLQGDLLAPVAGEAFNLIVSNPPYVAAEDRDTLSVEVRDHEPHLALFAGGDGLDVYRRLIPAAHVALAPGGWLLLEIGYGQSAAVQALLAHAGFQQIHAISDLQGIPRVLASLRP